VTPLARGLFSDDEENADAAKMPQVCMCVYMCVYVCVEVFRIL
jgi:hypothetical protein